MKLQIGVKVLIKNSYNQYLFIKRTELMQNEAEVSWDIPGGRIKPEESLEKALQREVNEELGVDLSDTTSKLLNAQDIFVPAKDLHVVRLTYGLDADLKSISLSNEHQDFRWIAADQIDSLHIEPFLRETLNHLA